MKGERFLRDILGVLIAAVLVLAACGGGATEEPPDTSAGGAPVVVEEEEEVSSGGGARSFCSIKRGPSMQKVRQQTVEKKTIAIV